MTTHKYSFRRSAGALVALALLSVGCADVHQIARAQACPRAEIEMCKRVGPRTDCQCIRRSAFSGDSLLAIP